MDPRPIIDDPNVGERMGKPLIGCFVYDASQLSTCLSHSHPVVTVHGAWRGNKRTYLGS